MGGDVVGNFGAGLSNGSYTNSGGIPGNPKGLSLLTALRGAGLVPEFSNNDLYRTETQSGVCVAWGKQQRGNLSNLIRATKMRRCL